MKRLLVVVLIITIVLLPASCMAQWVFAFDSGKSAFYYEDTRLSLSNMGNLRVFTTWAKRQDNNSDEYYVEKILYDVDNIKFQITSSTKYANGKVYPQAPLNYWQDVVPGTPLEYFLVASMKAYIKQEEAKQH